MANTYNSLGSVVGNSDDLESAQVSQRSAGRSKKQWSGSNKLIISFSV